MTGRRIAFVAPLKAPTHPVASGDRTMARALIAALGVAGFRIEPVSGLRLFEPAGDLARQQRLVRAAAGEAARFVARCQALPPDERPAAIFCYHCYYKAPDLVGPAVARALGVPYLIAEPSSAGKRAAGRWAHFHDLAEAAFDAADMLLPMTRRDRMAFASRAASGSAVLFLPPFLSRLPDGGPRPARSGPIALLTVAMMRESNKRDSYLALARALAHLDGLSWTLTIAGDGPARKEIERTFAPFGERVRFLGLVDDPILLDETYRAADIFVWPAVTEAYGMSLLEAQACGTPCVAGRDGGVEDVVMDGRTGVLAPPGDPEAFAAAIRDLAGDAARRARLGAAAAIFVREERSVAFAARRLAEALEAATARHEARARHTPP